ncbi:hypothetical protein HYFRA_00012276 [Hymenoscyphus fraxineus]|uniref:Heme haloperoxidase family profile domain-containing protein n=1 Tax=Hymenoscyphus fraxineus TaxID=746836 RepID=A0A9N9L367_9HELO|nr:hypothetical protein HYFRA_00012276 [Hymenoscyphus fraxineus]
MPSLSRFASAIVLALLLPASTLAQGLTIDITEYPFSEPGEGDSRGPCPALNALANHGILPRDGKNIDLKMARAASKYLGMGDGPVDVVFAGALKTSTTGNPNTLNLADFAQHEPQQVEYDASMSRLDAYDGDPGPFNEEVWARCQSSWADDSDIITYKDAVAKLKARRRYAQANNPTY